MGEVYGKGKVSSERPHADRLNLREDAREKKKEESLNSPKGLGGSLGRKKKKKTHPETVSTNTKRHAGVGSAFTRKPRESQARSANSKGKNQRWIRGVGSPGKKEKECPSFSKVKDDLIQSTENRRGPNRHTERRGGERVEFLQTRAVLVHLNFAQGRDESQEHSRGWSKRSQSIPSEKGAPAQK